MSGESRKALEGSERGGFWARRKAAVREAEAREEAEKLSAEVAEQRAALEEKTDAQILEELGLPEPETLQEGDDFRGFLSSAIPERIKKRALRRLWMTNPALANVDGLIEYGEDYTDAATVIAGMQTTYQVGKGMMAHIKKLAEEEAQAQELANGESDDPEHNEGAQAEELADGEPDDSPVGAIDQSEPVGTNGNADTATSVRPRSNEDHADGELTADDVFIHTVGDIAPATARVGDDDGSDGAHPIPGRRRMRFQTG